MGVARLCDYRKLCVQFTHQLDSAIRHLPRSSPYRPDIESLGEGLNGKEAEFRPVALHKELLQFIIKEWSQLPSEVREFVR